MSNVASVRAIVKNKTRNAKCLPGQTLQHPLVSRGRGLDCEQEIPSTPPEYQMLGILYVGINLAISEEPSRIEGVRIRIRRFIAGHRPYQRSAGRQTWPRSTNCLPRVSYDCGASGDRHPLVNVILHHTTRGG